MRVPEMRLDSLQPEASVSGGGFKDLFFFSPNPVEMIQFVLFTKAGFFQLEFPLL